MERILHIYLLVIALVIVALLATAAAIAGPRVPDAKAVANNPLIRTANYANCIRQARTGTGEVLVNGCSHCLVVSVTRTRAGESAPQVRKFNVLGGKSYTLPFRGPGRTSLGSIYPCDQANIVKPETLATTEEKCITLETDQRRGTVHLVNICRHCRAASVVRMAGNGQPLGQQSYIIGAKGNLRLSPNGASKVGLVGEDKCPRVLSR
ncbi:MAG: hypothetical protein VW268_11550 [Rhodospirillaceae bacterium]